MSRASLRAFATIGLLAAMAAVWNLHAPTVEPWIVSGPDACQLPRPTGGYAASTTPAAAGSDLGEAKPGHGEERER